MRKFTNVLFKRYLRYRYKRIEQMLQQPQQLQQKMLLQLLKSAEETEWGRKYGFRSIRTPEAFAKRVPLQDYESLKLSIRRMMYGEQDVLWPGRVQFFSKSSGTTNDKSKFIPISNQNLRQCHIGGAWDTSSVFYHHNPEANLFGKKNVLLGGSPTNFEGYPKTIVGDVSAIMLHNMPWVGRPFVIPDLETLLLPDFEVKVERMARVLIQEDVSMMGGVPSWSAVLFRRMLEITGKEHLLEIWPNFQLFIHGGVSFLPYRKLFRSFFPSTQVSYLETYNASEGYFAVQNDPSDPGLLLLLNNGVYFEFLPMDQWGKDNSKVIPLWEVKKDKNYAMVISTNAGLWRYLIGDTVRFTSTDPYKIVITGRTKQFINAFGEELMVENAEKALAVTCAAFKASVTEFTVAPIYFEGSRKGGHEWLVEFDRTPENIEAFADQLDKNLQLLNSDYEAKRFRSTTIERLRLHPVPAGTFYEWMKKRKKLGGQNKVPRLCNERRYVDKILKHLATCHQ